MVMQHHKPECHAEKLIHFVQCQCYSEGLYNQNMIISVVFSKLLLGLQSNVVHKPECPVAKWDYCILRSRSQQWFKISVNVCPDDIF